MTKSVYNPPMYIQIKDLFMKKIINEDYKRGDKLPSERDISIQYGVSRMTARHALTELVREGWAYTSHGQGTFVALPKIEREFTKLCGFSQMLKEKGIQASNKVLVAKIIEPTKSIADKLNITLNQEVYYFERIRYGNGIPIALEYIYIPANRFPELLKHDFNADSIYQVIENEYGCRLKYATQWLSLAMVNSYESKLLDIEKSASVLFMEGTTYDIEDQAIEYSKTLTRGDRCVYYSELWRGPDEESE